MQKELQYIIMEYALIVYGGYIPLICQTEEIQCVVNTCPNRSELCYCVLCSIIRKCVLFYKSVPVYHIVNELISNTPDLFRLKYTDDAWLFFSCFFWVHIIRFLWIPTLWFSPSPGKLSFSRPAYGSIPSAERNPWSMIQQSSQGFSRRCLHAAKFCGKVE